MSFYNRLWYITTHTIMNTNILNKNIHQFMQFNLDTIKLQKQISTEQKQAKNKRLMHLSNNRK
jgi:hypothetical protein